MQVTSRFSVPVSAEKVISFIVFLMLFLSVVIPSAEAQIWEDFTVWYDGNGADSGHIYEVHYKSGSNDVTLKDNAASDGSADEPYVKQGCSFIGWSLEPENSSVITPILPGGTVWEPVDVPVTWSEDKSGFVFYARWKCDSAAAPSPMPVINVPAATATLIPVIDVPVATATPMPAFPAGLNYAPIMEKTAAPSLLISPSGAQRVTEEVPVIQGATPTPVLLIYPDFRSRTVQKDGDNFEEDAGSGVPDDSALLIAPSEQDASAVPEKSVKNLPVLFTPENGELPALPATGITTQNGYKRSQMPASISYEPTYLELQIPTLNIHSEIVVVEHDESGYPVQWLETDTGLLAGSSLPGEGFSVLAGHNTLNAEEFGPFALIRTMRTGDRLFVRTDRNELMIFEVYSNEKINEYDYEALYQAGSIYDNTITLLTCEDERPEGGYTNRRIVSARKLN